MKKFRLPRKIKKKLYGLWLYPKDEKGNSLMAHPKTSQEKEALNFIKRLI